jgi:carbon starvation protein CstA
MYALSLVAPALVLLAIAYGSNHFTTSRWVPFGHHFPGITGAGPLVSPARAMRFSYAPSPFWLLAGAVHAGPTPIPQ